MVNKILLSYLADAYSLRTSLEVDQLMKHTAISLFCGAGGCSLGFKQAGYSIVYANDKDAAAVETYRINFTESLCSNEDIDNLDFGQVLSEIVMKPGELDILIGGPPCQGFSTAGSRFWDDPRNNLLKQYVKALTILNPKWFIMENVEGLLTSNKGKYVYEAAKAFIELGYWIRIEKIYSQEYGIPQRRKRVLIIGNRLGHDFRIPAPKFQVSGQLFRNSDITISHAINSLPPATKDKGTLLTPLTSPPQDDFDSFLRGNATQISDHYYPSINGIQLQRITALKPGQTMKDLPEELQHESFKKRANRRVADGMPTEKRGGAPSGLKRLMGNEPSLTITGAATRELIHPVENRPLTIREAARIQTFPDDFVFCGNASQKIQQIGNAIPPILARVFAEHIRDNYGFEGDQENPGRMLGFLLTKAEAMSPALKNTEILLNSLMENKIHQYTLFG
ncbi:MULTISPECIES: DNA cytosine methyltransferase [Moorena]|uniref:Cytosine-specific methyltransferase n=1 Tax=Moorena producens 3L TaxID=489825 RepID=F4XNT6_9CYAN|nr:MULTISPECIES: DNA cytosine methyltransferase [Moorena]EGJ33707.1 DNA-methyltransferase [Moorena producens 3L]NEP68022.1 DNA cytosine methyltransferase [Moorena sp. SIO3A5]OLT64257.1 DNA (cytosine-5-)-methyltransferase [Moorena producens 3L]